MLKKILNFYIGPGLPLVHFRAGMGFKMLLVDFFVHPIRRRAAKYYLFLLKLLGLKVIAVTGSAGKTTVKEMIASILKLDKPTVWSKDNIDPVFNIPATILRCTPKTRYLVLEMGVEYKGEMDFYLWLAKPHVSVVTNVFPTHTLYFGGIKGVYKEKMKILKFLKKGDFAVLNKNNKYTRLMAKSTKANIIWFEGGGDMIKQNKNAAKAVGEIFGISGEKIRKGIQSHQRPVHRMMEIKHKSGALIFDDSYNSNPEALLASLKLFNQRSKGRVKVGVFGDMLELGKLEEKEHRRVGGEIGRLGFDSIVGVGKASKYLIDEAVKTSKKINAVHASDVNEAFQIISPLLTSKTNLFVKGSRSIGLERLVEML